MNTIPAFYFPSTLICVDDDLVVIDAYKALFEKNFSCIFYNTVQQVLDFFNQYKPQINMSSFLTEISGYEPEKSLFQSAVELQISKIVELTQNKHRFDEVSLLLADYYMPDMDGLQLCANLNLQSCKKALFTGTKDYLTVLQARNKGIINYFTNKSDNVEQIKEAMYDISVNYFRDLTTKITQHLGIDGYSPTVDPVFIAYFNDIVSHYNIAEYYLLDKNGSYLLLDQSQKKYVLIVHNDKSLDEFISVLEEYANMKHAILSLKNRAKVPFFGINLTWNDIDTCNIAQYLYQSSTVEGTNRYYVNLLDLSQF